MPLGGRKFVLPSLPLFSKIEVDALFIPMLLVSNVTYQNIQYFTLVINVVP
jgi:hypothetical protein